MDQKNRKPTIRDIAKEAGLSPSAVSQILTGKRKGRRGNLEAIQAAIKKLGYQQNMYARSLATGRSGTLGLAFFFDVVDLFNAQLLAWVETLGRQNGYDIVPMNFLPAAYGDTYQRNEAVENARALFFDPLIQRRVEGIITQGYILNTSIIQHLRDEGIPLSVWEPEEETPTGVSVTRVDWDGIMHTALSHLHSLGHEEITFVTGVQDFATVREQMEAFTKTMDALGLDPENHIAGSSTLHSEEWGQRFVSSTWPDPRRPRCSALLCGDDRIAMGALSALWELGLRVPEDVSLMGINDVHYATYMVPPLTTIHVDVESAARLLTEGLLAALRGEDCAPQYCDFSLVQRSTTGPRTGVS